MPRNSLTNGKPAPDTFNTQLDECAYPLVMALAVGLTGRALLRGPHQAGGELRRQPRAVVRPERWEEQGGFSPSTIAAEIAGLLAAAQDRRPQRRPRSSAAVWRGVADEFQRNLKTWTLTTNGPLGHGRTSSACRRPATRTRPSATTSATAARRSTSATVIDAGLPRVRAARPAAPTTIRTSSARSPIVDATIRRSDRQRRRLLPLQRRRLRRPARPTATRGRRSNKGNGHLWPVLAGERGQYEVDRGMRRRGDRAPGGDAQHVLGRRPDRRAGVGGCPTSPRSPFGTRPERRRRSASRTASRPARPRR